MRSIQRILVVLGAMALVMALTPNRAFAQRSGVEVWAQTCGNCHTAQPAGRYSAENWQRLMRHMKITARMTDDDADAVRQFLMGSARRIAAGAPGDPSQRVGTGVPVARDRDGAGSDSTATGPGRRVNLTPAEAKALTAYIRTISAR